MKVILCTGDSHTCGQGADNILSATKVKNPNDRYDTSGKGLGGGACDLVIPGYVNLVRQFVVENTDSRHAVENMQILNEKYGYPLDEDGVLLNKELVIENSWDMILLCVGERPEAAEIAVYLDGKLYKNETLHTPIPRYNDWSFRNVPIRCEGAKEVKIVPVSGKAFIHHIQYAAGEYVVINSGIGSCTSKRYFNECFDYCVTDFQSDIVVAEGHSINDWIQYATAQEHYDCLKVMLEKFKEMGAKVLFTTVSPIESKQENAAGNLYQGFIDASRQVAADLDIPVADAHEKFCEALAPIPKEERSMYMYVDKWHVNARGHKIYADAITEKLKEML